MHIASPSPVGLGSADRGPLVRGGVWVYLAGYVGWVAFLATTDGSRGALNDLLFLPIVLAAGWAGLRASKAWADQPRLARGWATIGAAWLCSGAGIVGWLLNRSVASPGLDDLAWFLYNSYYLLALIGLWHFFDIPARGLARIRLGIETLIVVTAVIVVAWYFVFRFDQATGDLSDLAKRIATLFFCELLLAAGATAVLHRPAAPGDRRALATLGIGTFAGVLADLAYEQDLLLGSIWPARVADLALALGATLVASAALGSRRRTAASPPLGLDLGLTLLPYLAVGIVAVILVVESIDANLGRGPIAGLIIGGAFLFVLVIIRLLVAHQDFAREAEARAAQDARFRSLVQRSTDAVVVVGPDGTIRSASPAFGRMIGQPDADPTGHPFDSQVHPGERDRVSQWLRSGGLPALTSWRIGRGDGWVDVEAAATDLRGDPAVAGVLISLRDVGERVRLEAELRQAQKMEVVGRLSSSIAHDFNNLLTVIIGNLQFAKAAAPAAIGDDLGLAEGAARRGISLARQLLLLARPSPPATNTADLGELIRSFEAPVRHALPSSIEIRFEISPHAMPVVVDDVQLEQVLLNLAINSRDAMAEGGEFAVTVGPDADGWARLEVADTGTGMAEETAARAFEPFFTTKAVGLGTGLGLSTVRRIIEELGGTVGITSRPGVGTTVIIRLPPATSAHSVDKSPATTPDPFLGPVHVLVVDDEPALRRVLSRQLGAAGCRVTEAGDGHAALDLLRHDATVDVLLTDLIMPKMRGEELARRVLTEFPRIGVLCISGTPGQTTDGAEPWSGDRVLTKPVDLHLLVDRIGRVSSRGAGAPAGA